MVKSSKLRVAALEWDKFMTESNQKVEQGTYNGKSYPEVALSELDACPLCGSKNHSVLIQEYNQFAYAHEGFSYLNQKPVQILKCSDCSFGYNRFLPEEWFFMDVLYNPPKDVIWWEHPNELGNKEYIISGILRLLTKFSASGTIVDLGASTGRFLYRIRQSGMFTKYLGIENDPNAVSMAKAVDLEIINCSLNEGLEKMSQSVDVISLIDVLEHIPYPKALLEKIFDSLPSNGLLYIKVPLQSGQYFKESMAQRLGFRKSMMGINFIHVNHFSEKSLIHVLTNLGFVVEHIHVAGPELYPKPKNMKQRVSNLFRFSQYFAARILRSILPLNIGMNVEVLARKP